MLVFKTTPLTIEMQDYRTIVFFSKIVQIFTEVGQKTKASLDYTCLEMIYEEAKPQLSSGNYANALEYMIEQYR